MNQNDNNYLMSVIFFNTHFNIVYADISTGEISIKKALRENEVLDSIESILPAEIILPKTQEYEFILKTNKKNLVTFIDNKYLEIESKKVRKWRGIMSPFLFAGLGFLTKGVTMAIAEGDQSNNETLVPLYTGIGGSVSALSSIPFWLRNKSYDLTTGNYEILIP